MIWDWVERILSGMKPRLLVQSEEETETSSMRMEKLIIFDIVDLVPERTFVSSLFYQLMEVAGELGSDTLKALN